MLHIFQLLSRFSPRAKPSIEGSFDQPGCSSERADRKASKKSAPGVGVGVAETAQQVAQAAQDDKALKVHSFQSRHTKTVSHSSLKRRWPRSPKP